jgi:hypothetical protein
LESEWILSEAPAIITPEIFDKAQLQLAHNREVARRMHQPSSCRYLLLAFVTPDAGRASTPWFIPLTSRHDW